MIIHFQWCPGGTIRIKCALYIIYHIGESPAVHAPARFCRPRGAGSALVAISALHRTLIPVHPGTTCFQLVPRSPTRCTVGAGRHIYFCAPVRGPR